MKLLLSGCIVLLSMIGFVSCQKEVEGSLTEQVGSDTTFLDRIYSLDSISPTQTDTFSKSFLIYDNQKRLKQALTYTVGEIDTFRTDYFYTGTDTLPFKSVDHTLSDIGLGLTYYRDTTFYQYDMNGKIIKDSSLERYVTGNQDFGVSVRDFGISGNKVVIDSRAYDLISGQYVLRNTSVYRKAVFVTTINGNIVQQTDTAFGFSTGIQLTYNNNPDPAYKVNKVHYPILYNDGDSEQKNLLISSVVTSPSSTNSFQYNYIYRSDGYPSTIWLTDQTGYKIKTVLFYKTL